MLQIGQRVIIDEDPTYGCYYFDSDYIDTEDLVSGIRKHGDETYAYQLEGEDEDCWWLENELTAQDEVLVGRKPKYMVDDEVTMDGEPQTVKRIAAVVSSRHETVYELDGEGAYVDECEIALYRTHGDDRSEYTLF